jgi:hypothetical protein
LCQLPPEIFTSIIFKNGVRYNRKLTKDLHSKVNGIIPFQIILMQYNDYGGGKMEIAKRGKPFRLDSLYDGWDEAPKKAGIYVVYTGRPINIGLEGLTKREFCILESLLFCVIGYTNSGTSSIRQVGCCGHTQR